jgi:hypothetical protein
MPGGGLLATAGGFPHNVYMNDDLEVAFIGTLTNGEQGLYLSKNGSLVLVAKTGTDIDGLGAIASLDDFGAGAASTQISMNDHGQILFAAKFTSNAAAVLVATPK